ncbi:GntR family transcriptional regulator [Szabonella alba]|uniref:GntR family transcriptional regulator n=1 Tax=Szabonella alba TaxID=2804194 RepID=A0A8K0VAH7_9RHOB|nr:GntR family transcriptional regulator [Szabonella alba]MBL4918487.1 GntR family transcriptional regulator [Szabonella alba]
MKQPPDLQSEQAFQALLVALRDGRLRSSEFHTVPALVEVLGFPLAPTREAVKRAEDQSLVTILPKRGVLIMEAGPDTTRACMDMRATLETEGVRRLLLAGRPDLADLRATHEALLHEARTDPGADLSRRALATDLSLHDFMARGLDNIFLRQAYEANRSRITVIQNVRAFLPDRVIPAMEEHLAIIDAIETGSAETAATEIRRHLRLTLRWWGVAIPG